jgi:peptide/nickel transport system substrate-binding protein
MNSTLQPDRREFTIATASLAVAATLPAATVSAAPTPVRGGTLKVAQCSANRRTADATNARHPYFFVDLSTRVAYNCLTWVNEKLEWEPELAREVVATDDKLNVWDVAIREGVLFHDGREMTSADVVASFEAHQKGAAFASQIQRVEGHGKYRVRFHLREGNSEFPYILAEYQHCIMQADTPARIGLNGIGTGPFKFVAADPNRSATFERHEQYWRKGFPYLDRLEIHNREGQQEAALNGLRARQFDAVLTIDARGLRQLQRDPDLEFSVGRGSYHFVIQLPKHPGSPFEDKRVRQAFALAIDREAIVRIAYGGRYGWVGNDSHLVSTDPAFLYRPARRDVAQAKRLLAEAGYPNGITLPTLYFSPQLPEVPIYFQVLQQTVREAGINLPIEERPADGYAAFRTGDNDLSKGKFHKFAMTAVGSRNPGISLNRMRGAFVESGHWRGPEHDRYMALYRQAMVTRDDTLRKRTYHEMQRILQEEVPAILPAGGDSILARRKSVQGLNYHPQIWSIRFEEVWRSA